MGKSGLRADLRSLFYRTLWALGRHYCDKPTCPTVVADRYHRGHYAWWHS